MAIESRVSDEGVLFIEVGGRFDFSCHEDFRNAYEDVRRQPRSHVIDLSGATHLDSSALGMLLLLRDYAGGEEANIRIINCNDEIRKILVISNFEQLFQID